MTKEELGKITEAVEQIQAAKQISLLDKIPGGAAGALVCCLALVWLGKNWVDDTKQESVKQNESLIRIEQNQKLLAQDFGQLKETVKDLDTKTGDRWTRGDAVARATQIDKEIAELKSQLNIRGKDWMPMIERRIQKLELMNKIDESNE